MVALTNLTIIANDCKYAETCDRQVSERKESSLFFSIYTQALSNLRESAGAQVNTNGLQMKLIYFREMEWYSETCRLFNRK